MGTRVTVSATALALRAKQDARHADTSISSGQELIGQRGSVNWTVPRDEPRVPAALAKMSAVASTGKPRAFVGYPSRPELSRETHATAIELIQKGSEVDAFSWEDLDVTGRLIISQITKAIDESDISIFDVTALNQNVLFEVGYAIGSDKRVWLVRDKNDAEAESQWRAAGILNGVGYFGYENAYDLSGGFLKERPFETEETLYQDLIEPVLDPVEDPTLFHVRSPSRTQADRELIRRIARERRNGIKITVADPRESPVETLQWYAYHCYQASAVVSHLTRPGRRDADLHNARCALVAGLAHGMQRPVLMLAEEGYEAPIDYRGLLYVYRTARECRDQAGYWLRGELTAAYSAVEKQAEEREKRSLSTELSGLRLGEPIAENEADRLSRYFVTTSAYQAALEPRSAVFVGRKGAGKTANFLQAATELSKDRHNLVCLIQPADYDLEGLVHILESAQRRDTKGYLVEALWKYLVTSEIALSTVDDVKDRPAGVQPESPEWDLTEYVRKAGKTLDRDFAVRLESVVDSIRRRDLERGSIDEARAGISEALHGTLLRELSEVLAPVLVGYDRVAVLIDNLDQAWDAEGDIAVLSQLLLGLLSSTARLGADLSKRGRHDVVMSVAVFIRADIYSRVVQDAREPDKISARAITWSDPATLVELVQERYVASHAAGTPRDEIWNKYFTGSVGGMPTPEHLARIVLPRPRDMLWLTNAAIESAVRHHRSAVDESDIVAAERVYSENALQALLVEGQSSFSKITDVVFEFAGSEPVLSKPDVIEALRRGGVPSPDAEAGIDRLLSLSFLGQEVRAGDFEYEELADDRRRIDALASRYAASRGAESRFAIHPAFRSYLDVVSTPGQQLLE